MAYPKGKADHLQPPHYCRQFHQWAHCLSSHLSPPGAAHDRVPAVTASAKQLIKYLSFLALGVLGFMVVCAILEAIGTGHSEFRHDPLTWGTFGDWASAILPTFAILVTAHMWLRDKQDASQYAAKGLLSGISLTKRNAAHGSHLVLKNTTKFEVLLPALGKAVAPETSADLGLATTDSVTVRIDKAVAEIDLQGNIRIKST